MQRGKRDQSKTDGKKSSLSLVQEPISKLASFFKVQYFCPFPPHVWFFFVVVRVLQFLPHASEEKSTRRKKKKNRRSNSWSLHT